MKDVGFTNEGDRLVEMSQEEYNEFSSLCRAVEGKTHPELFARTDYRLISGFDFAKTFDVIRAYYLSKFRISEIQNLLDAMKKSLDKKG